MQKFFLYPQLALGATKGSTTINATVNMIEGFRAANMKVCWTFGALDLFELLTNPPAFKSGLLLSALIYPTSHSALIWALWTVYLLAPS